MKTDNFCLMLTIIPSLLLGNIVELNLLEKITDYIEPCSAQDTLVIFDIDNTLQHSKQHIGSVAWGDYMALQLERKGISKHDAQIIESHFWIAVQPHVEVAPVDPAAKLLIEKLQNQQISVMCLTGRMPKESANTHRQLKSIGIDISANPPITEIKQELPLQYAAMYEEGVLFATPVNAKSAVLLAFLNKNDIRPKRIIFVDDKLHHVEDVVEALENIDIECVGIRFGGADDFVKQFDPAIADVQWKAFPPLLSNAEAEEEMLNLK